MKVSEVIIFFLNLESFHGLREASPRILQIGLNPDDARRHGKDREWLAHSNLARYGDKDVYV